MERYNISIFIKKSKNIHGDKYDYSKVNYINTKTNVTIICPKHGEFEQNPKHHYNGIGCPKCSGSKKMTTETFVSRAKKKHGDKYDYSKVNYKNRECKISIICLEHGEFPQRPADHLNGHGCRRCLSLSNNEFIILAKNIHNTKYDYSLVSIKTNQKNISIICPKYGEFRQTPHNHIKNKQGCPICKESKGERKIRNYLLDNNIKFIREKRFKNCKDKYTLSFDFYIPLYNICIEYNGIQHYKPVKYFGGVTTFEEQQKRDKIKKNYCDKNHIKLLIIKYNENVITKLRNFKIFN